jgi:hypothetical protein
MTILGAIVGKVPNVVVVIVVNILAVSPVLVARVAAKAGHIQGSCRRCRPRVWMIFLALLVIRTVARLLTLTEALRHPVHSGATAAMMEAACRPNTDGRGRLEPNDGQLAVAINGTLGAAAGLCAPNGGGGGCMAGGQLVVGLLAWGRRARRGASSLLPAAHEEGEEDAEEEEEHDGHQDACHDPHLTHRAPLSGCPVLIMMIYFKFVMKYLWSI